MNFVGKYLILPLTILLGLYGIYVLHSYYVSPRLSGEIEKPSDVRRDEARRNCLVTHVADDGKGKTQHRYMAHAILNLSEEKGGMSICEIHRLKLALAAPSQEKNKWTRLTDVAGWLEKLPIIGDRENYAQAEMEVDRVLQNRRADYAREPCLASITRFIRRDKWGTVQNEGIFEKEMTLLFDDKQGARFYGPKGSTNKCT